MGNMYRINTLHLILIFSTFKGICNDGLYGIFRSLSHLYAQSNFKSLYISMFLSLLTQNVPVSQTNHT